VLEQPRQWRKIDSNKRNRWHYPTTWWESSSNSSILRKKDSLLEIFSVLYKSCGSNEKNNLRLKQKPVIKTIKLFNENDIPYLTLLSTNSYEVATNIVRNFTFMWPCIATNFFIIKPTRCTNFTNLFWHKTLHVSESSSVRHQGFIHCTLRNGMSYGFVDSFRAGPARKLSTDLYDIYHSWFYSE